MAVKTIHLHGLLAEKFGPVHRMHVETVAEAGRALGVVLPGFRKEVREKFYRVRVGPIDLSERDLGLRLGRTHEMHIIPALEGAGGSGSQKIIFGALLIGATIATAGAMGAFAPVAFGPMGAGAAAGAGLATPLVTIGGTTLLTYGNIAAIGAMIALGGVAQMLAPSIKTPKGGNTKDQKTSFLFNGPINVISQGGVVPLAYGEVLVGSVVASAGLIVEQLLTPVGGEYGPAAPPPQPPPPTGGRAHSSGFSPGFS